jgi:hypothetical protein
MISNSDEFVLTLKELSKLLLRLEQFNEWMEAEHEQNGFYFSDGRFSNETITSVKVKWWQLN